MKATIKKTMQRIMGVPKVAKALAQIENEAERRLEEQMELCAIPSPSNYEGKRARRFREMFAAAGFDNAYLDDVNNVLARYKGSGEGPVLLLSAHMDTVFDLDVDCIPRVDKDGIIHAPGIADDTGGMAEVLTVARVMRESGIIPRGDIIFAGNVGEEALGNLRGMRNIFEKPNDVDAFISIDGSHPGWLTYNALGSYMYRIVYRGKGGHVHDMFGYPNPNFALARAAAKIADIGIPGTSFNVGVIKGGTVISAIPSEATMLIGIRSPEAKTLEEIRTRILSISRKACDEENARWNHPTGKVSVDIECIDERPCGQQHVDDDIVQAAIAAIELFGNEPRITRAAGTDANIPISLGIPAIAIGRGGYVKYGHTVKEQYDPTDAHIGPQRALVLALTLVGLEGVCEPLIKTNKAMD
jgi:tripeptide aminopeptidase